MTQPQEMMFQLGKSKWMVYYNNIYNEFLLLTGAFGYFEVTNDITKYTKSTVFETIGKKTPVGMRFSTVGGESGSADTVR